MIGQILTHFKITAKLGEGGMGAVWRAEDTKLGREVAIKILPEAFADDPERLARFEREAHVLASLNHPNIAGIYEVGAVDVEGEALHFLAMELAEGQDLADYLGRGPLPADEVVSIALQIAAGLEAAHEKGVVHRDLKPANVMISPDGGVKILDFGLAKPSEEPTAASADMSASPTMTAQMTRDGVILGTLGYMSPEQARGIEADQRSDIWAFGVILWEMLTGQRMFNEPTVSDTLVAVLRGELEIDALPAETPWGLREVVELCLQRESRDRLHSIADARLALSRDWVQPSLPAATSEGPTGTRPWGRIAAAAALALAAGVFVGRSVWRGEEQKSDPVRLSMEVEPMTTASNLIALSPDGRVLVYAAGEPSRLYRRPLDALDAIAIPGTEGAQSPFFSPDGEWVAFFAGSSLKKVPMQGGGPITLAEFPDQKGASMRGGAWSEDGRVFFTIFGTGRLAYGTLLEVPAVGGEPREVLSIRDAEGRPFEVADPQLLPGERELLFTRIAGDRFYSAEAADLQVLDLSTGEVTTVLEHHGMGHYLPSGHLVAFQGDNTITVAPFDPESLEITGPSVPIRDLVHTMRDGVTGHFTAARNGTVAFQRAQPGDRDNGLVWLGLDGTVTEVPAETRPFLVAMVAPDGERALVSIGPESSGQLWLYDFGRRMLTALTTEGGAFSPIWSGDGESVFFHSDRSTGPPSIHRIPAAGGSAEVVAETATVWTAPWDVSPDGETLAFFLWNPETAADWDIRLTSTRGGGEWTTFAQEATDEMQPAFSPDGGWIAFVSNRSGKREIFLERFPEAGRLMQVTDQGGVHPIWTPDGSRLLYLNADRSLLMAMDVTWGEQPSFSRSYEVVEIPPALRAHAWFPWANLSPDGQRLLIATNRPLIVERLTVILDWAQELERLAPRKPR